MSQDLRAVLAELADHEGRALAAAAPEPHAEAQRIDALVRRRRVIRVTGFVAGGVAAALLVGVMAAQTLTAPAPVAPVAPVERSAEPTASPSPVPTPSPTTTSAPSADPDVSTPPAPPTARPLPVDVEEVMHGGPGPWWAVWIDIPALDAGSTETDAVAAQLDAIGYGSAWMPVPCVTGSIEQLGLDPMAEMWGNVLYFASAEDADTFVRLWDRPVAGVVADADLSCDWG